MATAQARASDLAAARNQLVAAVRAVVGETMTAEAIQDLLGRARAWSPNAARELAAHLADAPDALTAPSPRCPASLPRLLRLLDAAGHGEAITLLGCARCGRTNGALDRPTSEGRCCGWCATRNNRRRCARCGQDGHIVTRHATEGPICRRCYRNDSTLFTVCAGCGRQRMRAYRRADGAILCQTCAPRRLYECVRCHRQRPAAAHTVDGPLCPSCYDTTPRRCGKCGEVRSIAKRATTEEPDTCYRCYRHLGACVVCGRVRDGSLVHGRGFHCTGCYPYLRRQCDECGRTARTAAFWPRGALCPSCYRRHVRTPGTCAACGTIHVLVGRSPDGAEVCGPCCGVDIDFACRRCGHPGDLYAEGCCARCVMRDRVHDLLSQPDGILDPQLRPLAEALGAVEHPRSILNWLRKSPAATLLTTLAADQAEITHDRLDRLPQDRGTHHVRAMLVTTGILPERPEHLAQLTLWATTQLEALPPAHTRVLRPFVEWDVLRAARRRAARGRHTERSAVHDRRVVRAATDFLNWLDSRQLTLGTLTQEHLDLWHECHPAQRSEIRRFLRWAAARHLIGLLTLPPRHATRFSRFLSDAEQHEQLLRCLNDDTLPLQVRIVGALIRLYGLPVSRIVALTADRFHRDENRAYLNLDRHPVLLPPRLARLIEEQIARPRRYFVLQRSTDSDCRYLFPGQPPHLPRSASSVCHLLRRHHLPVAPARNTAMLEAATTLPPIVLSDLFGISTTTANAWSTYSQTNWVEFLTAGETSPRPQR
ncbi:hypothetical protein AB0J55_00370 [Amycolatopsis sp. NPDC049688]|uniref:hypothetical protein n=1 Tax=Amycolatopsis sp. NPDC049688 TaxID=3154733 RepID=UPI003437A1E6